MSTLMETLIEPESRLVNKTLEINGKPIKTRRKKCALKSKENIFKPQCRRELKKKLKKYKLRRDGQEDQEVLDVSQILISALKIKSPSSNNNSKNINDIREELRPTNYLFKMGRRKQIIEKKDLDNCDNDTITTHKERKSVKSDVNVSKKKETCTVSEEYQLKPNENKKTVNHETPNKDKKQTNAFQLMMDSRNKSIGSNSPGKDKVVDESELQDIVEKKTIKAKRNLLLQKMAEEKGSLKKKEIEEYHEQCIKKKMEKRAERLKKMIAIKKSKPVDHDSDIEILSPQKEMPTNNNNHSASKTKTLKLVNIFHDSVQNVNVDKKKVKKSKEDDEFLKKLSPSIKKKENMLCYFKKVEKEQDSDDIFDSQNVEDETVIIKVKMTPRSKKTLKKKKLSLNKDASTERSQNDENGENKLSSSEKGTSESLMKLDKLEDAKVLEVGSLKSSENHDDLNIIRPRRNVKRPAKYIDDVQPSSSDEELHIFTPKKKKQIKKTNCVPENKIESQTETSKKTHKEENKSSVTKKSTKVTNEDNKQKKPTKLAPIFAAKPQLDAAALEAKQRFLSSGVPEKLKKTMEKPSYKNLGGSSYHTVVHVQQKELHIPDTECEFNFRLSDFDEDPINEIIKGNDIFKKIISSSQLPIMNSNPMFVKSKPNEMLQKIKQLYPKFPVYRTYRMLRDKNKGEFKDCSYLDLDNSIEVINGLIDINNESPDKLNWTDKYKALSSKQIIGNFESIKELKKWLITWTENDVKLKKANGADSDSSDFYHSDTDSKDSIKSTNNLLVLTGPAGSGKTSIVYAVAAELAIKVLEVNASSKRTGKIMLQDLQEATQSHKVNRGKSSQSSAENSQKSQDIIPVTEKPIIKIKKRGRPKKTTVVETTLKKAESVGNEVQSQPSSQDSTRTCMSLILIDDADIVFEQDDGFCSAIVQLVQCSKRPVILITSSLTCPHLQRFLHIAKVLHTRPYFPRMLGTWLDILCLADNGMCWPGLGAKILDYFNGDIRKSMNFLQFHTVRELTNDSETASQNSDLYKIDMDDENSSMSWTDREVNDENSETTKNQDDNIWQCFMREKANLCHPQYPPQLFNIWWNIPRLVNAPSDCKVQSERDTNENCKKENKHQLGLDTISNVAEMISIADCYRHKDIEFSLTSVPWATFESHSVSEQQSLDKYDRNNEIIDEISHSLVTGSILTAQKALDLEQNTRLEFPGMAIRRERDKVSSRHNSVTSYLNPSATLDRRALALDYWSSCRSICRIEKSRTDSNSKRNNRFCHYLKSVNILCKSDSFDNLGNSLYSEENK
ncbi:hypothetical protein ABMA28_004604 [Loxostege sticticalis]|uniref:AAA+ ATPase domain-containing protein n=1 Tax=Loxostege sticticalis TaxID=481309 RepID=A0ABD0SRT5_LOXSC